MRDAALRLIGFGSDDDYRVTKTLQLVQSELGDSIGLLAQGSWTLRSLAAIPWAESNDMPDELGSAFSQDRDVRVRRALARALAKQNTGMTQMFGTYSYTIRGGPSVQLCAQHRQTG